MLTMTVAVWLGSTKLHYIFEMMTCFGIPLHFGLIQLFLAIPAIVMFSLPAAVLLASVLVLGVENRKELLYLRASGISFFRLIKMPILIGLLTTLLYIALAQFVVPSALQTSSKLWLLGLYKSELPLGQTSLTRAKLLADGSAEQVLFVGNYVGDQLKDIIFLEFQKQAGVKVTHAPTGLWWRGKWILKGGTTYELSNATSNRTFKFEKLVLPNAKDLTEALKEHAVPPKKLPFLQLSQYLKTTKLHAKERRLLEGSLWDQIFTPLACLGMIFAGATSAIGTTRSAVMKIAFPGFTIVAYYFFKSTVDALVENSRLDPILGAVLPTLALGAIAVIYLALRCGELKPSFKISSKSARQKTAQAASG